MMRLGVLLRLSSARVAALLCGLCAGWVGQPAGAATPADWPVDPMDWRSAAVDLSFLNAGERPAGKHGFVHAQHDRLRFDDGATARFWGTNLTAAALFGTSREAARQQARRLSQLGFNLVRIHHHDSYWVTPNIFGDAEPASTDTLDASMLDWLDWWIRCLKDEGIYVWLDLHVQRQLRAGDHIADFDEIAKGRSGVELKGYNYVNADIREAMKRFNESYLGHVNAYTGVAYKDEPAIAAVLVTNENDVTQHFAGLLLPDKKVPAHTARYMAQARAFAAAHELDPDKAWRSWQNGPSRLFLNDLEHRFNTGMIEHLRQLGVKVPIVTTSWWGGRMFSLPSLSDGDLIDVHAYENTDALRRDPRRDATIVHRIAAGRLAGRPLSVTEWNMGGFPAPDRQVLPLYVAASAAHQGWDAMMQYAYSQVPLQSAGRPSNWHLFNDPAMLALMPAAALLYRQQHVRPATRTFLLAPNAAQLFDQGISTADTPGMRTAAEIGRVATRLPSVKELPWLRAAESDGSPGVAIEDLERPLIADSAHEIVSDTQELRRDWARGLFTVDSARTQAAVGRLGGLPVTLNDVELAMEGEAGVAVQSLDGAAIAHSRSMLISIGTSSVPSAGQQLPFHTEAPAGTLSIRAPRGLRLRTLGAGHAGAPQMAYRAGRYVIRFDGRTPVHWLQLQAPRAARKGHDDGRR